PVGIDGSVHSAGFVVKDFDGDGRLDLAVREFDANRVSVLLGNGDGTFRVSGRYAVGTGPISIVSGDFDGDGRLDLAVSNRDSDALSVLFGRGDGTFREQVRTPLGTRAQTLAAGDFDGDGRSDLAQGDLSETVSILLSRGD